MISGQWPVVSWSCRKLAIAVVLFLTTAARGDVWTYTPHPIKISAARFFYLDKPVSATDIKIFRAKKTRSNWKPTVLVKNLRSDAAGDVTIPKLPKGKYFFDLSAGGYGYSLLFDVRGENKKRMLIKLRPQIMCGSYFDIVSDDTKENGP